MLKLLKMLLRLYTGFHHQQREKLDLLYVGTGKINLQKTQKPLKKAIQVQVYNTGKSYELNMYKEDLDEAVELDESFKAGGLKLKDGKQVMVKKDDATMLNDLMKQLSKPNVKKMTDTAMRDKKGYMEILGFAKDSHE